MYVFDIDGTLADATHRLHHIQKEPKDWDAFNDSIRISKDLPIFPIIRIANALFTGKEHVILLTGRRESTRKDTILWLNAYYIQYHALLMRPDGDQRCDYLVKLELLREYLAQRPVEERMVHTMFEYRNSAVQHFRQEGFHVCQVAEGDF